LERKGNGRKKCRRYREQKKKINRKWKDCWKETENADLVENEGKERKW
jgi:hypothetical protein